MDTSAYVICSSVQQLPDVQCHGTSLLLWLQT